MPIANSASFFASRNEPDFALFNRDVEGSTLIVPSVEEETLLTLPPKSTPVNTGPSYVPPQSHVPYYPARIVRGDFNTILFAVSGQAITQGGFPAKVVW